MLKVLRIQERSKTDRLQKFLKEVCERYFADTDQLGSTEGEHKLLVLKGTVQRDGSGRN